MRARGRGSGRRDVAPWLLGAGLLAGAPLAGADFAAGVAAYNAGDFVKAAVEFHIAAEKGEPLAQLNLGLLYDAGQGVEQSYPEAVGWYRKAADQGVVTAQYNLASMYLQGLGVDEDRASAAAWYRRAALGGHALAQYNLSVMYEDGIGVERDLVQAYAWRRIASREEGTVPPEEIEALMSQLAPTQIEEAEALVEIYDRGRGGDGG